MDSNQILTDGKNLQVHFVGGPKMRSTNSRWRTAAILKNRRISATVWPILTKFSMLMYMGHQHSEQPLKFRKLQCSLM